MNHFTEHELICYVTGDVSADQAARIEHSARRDKMLAGSIELLAALAGCPQNVAEFPRRTIWQRMAHAALAHRLVAALVLALAALGAMGSAYYVWANQPLFHDDFQLGIYDLSKWEPVRDVPDVTSSVPEMGFMRLINRGYLVTKDEFEGPISVDLDWKWIRLGDDPLYSDSLNVVLRTSGQPRATRPWEVEDGISVTFDCVRNSVTIAEKSANRALAISPVTSVPMPANEWHQIKITDDGMFVEVYIRGPSIRHDPKQPVLRAKIPEGSEHRQVCIYNREVVGMARIPHESAIDNVVIRALRPRGKR